MRKKRHGFSLVEMIVAMVIASSLGFAVLTTFSQGVRLWSRAAKERMEWKVSLFIDKLTEELRNEYADPKWNFQGTQTLLQFATIAQDSGSVKGKGFTDRPVYLRYDFDTHENAVTLQKYSLEEIFLSSKLSRKKAVPVLEKVGFFGLEYYARDPKVKGARWKKMWNKNCFPGTVKVTIGPLGFENQRISRIIETPKGDGCT